MSAGSIAAWPAGPERATLARPIAIAFGVLAGPTLFAGNLPTFDAPCVAAVLAVSLPNASWINGSIAFTPLRAPAPTMPATAPERRPR